jgi:hypothetical protein
LSEQPKRTAAQTPVSAHPAFPAIVALWFAALLGLGSLVLPIALFEFWSEASGLAALVAAAKPPLGLAARLVIAIAAAGLGALAGVAIARQVIAGHRPRSTPPVASPSQPESVKRPIRAHDELGEDGFDAQVGAFAPPARDYRDASWPLAEAGPAPEPFDLAGFDAPEYDADAWSATDAEEEARDAADFAAEPGTIEAAPAPNRDAGSMPVAALEARPARALGELGMAELVERFSRALQQHQHDVRAVAPGDAVTDVDRTPSFAGKAAEHDARVELGWAPEAEEPEEAPEAYGSYSSLLAMKNSHPVPRARTPIAAPRETEAALREALERLQAMSGAA